VCKIELSAAPTNTAHAMNLTVDVNLIRYLFAYIMCINTFHRQVHILTTHAWCTVKVHLLSILLLYMSSHFWYPYIISLYSNCKGEASTSVLPFYITVALPDNGRDYRPKHVAVNAINN
jgi:hypothetical protein